MTWRPSLALLLALALVACGAGRGGGERDPGDWRAMLHAGNGAGAEAALERALDNGAPQGELAPFLGEAELLQGDFAAADHWLSDGRFAPGVAAHGFHMLGRLRMEQGNLPAAGQAFDRALSEAADEPGLWVDIGRLRWRGGEQAQAIEAADKALALRKDEPAALLFKAQLVRESAGNAAALPILERGLVAAPGDAGLLGDYAATLGELGRNIEMLAAVRQLEEAAPADRKVLWLQAVLAARAGRFDLARSLLQRGGDFDREMPAAILLLGVIDLENGNYASAAQGFDRLSRIQPDNPRVTMLLARALAVGGQHRDLVARFENRAQSPYVSVLMGRAYEALGDRERAAPFLDSARNAGGMTLAVLPGATAEDVKGQPGVAVGVDTVGQVRGMLAAGRAQDASARARAFVGRQRGSADALALAGDTVLDMGDPKAALAYYRRSAAIKRPWYLTKRMIAALDRSGKQTEATRLVETHLAGEPGNADAAILLARRHLDQGDRQAAAALADRARALGRNDALLARIARGT